MLEPSPPRKLVNPALHFAEERFAVFAILVFSGVLTCSSYYNVSEGIAGYGFYVSSRFDTAASLMQLGIYAVTIFLLLARLKSVVIPALRDPFIWALVALIVFSFIWSDFPELSQKASIKTLYTTLFGLYFASRFTLKEQLRIVAWALIIAAVFSLMYTLAFRGAGIEQGTHSGSWRGPLIHKNHFGRLMVVSALACLLAAFNSSKYRYVLWAGCALSVALLMLSDSGTGVIVFVTLVALLPFYRALRLSDSLAIPFFITLITVAGGIALWAGTNWNELLFRYGKDPTLSGRTYIWDAVIERLWQRPWLGYGYHGFWEEKGESVYVFRAVHYLVYQAHNGFLNIAIELGLLGLFCYAMSTLFTYIRAIKWVRSDRTSAELWPIAYVTFLLMYNYTETTTVAQNSIFWVLFVAISLSLKRVQWVKLGKESRIREKKGLVEQS
jgi:O-antigen ligase